MSHGPLPGACLRSTLFQRWQRHKLRLQKKAEKMRLSTQSWVTQIAASSPGDSFKVTYTTATAEEEPLPLQFSQEAGSLRLVEITHA